MSVADLLREDKLALVKPSASGYTDISENKMSEPVDGKTSSILIFTAIAVAAFFIYPHVEFFGVGIYSHLQYLDVAYLSGDISGAADLEIADTTYSSRYPAVAGELLDRGQAARD